MCKIVVFTSNDLFAGWALEKSAKSYPDCFAAFVYAKDPFSTPKKRLKIFRNAGFRYVIYQAFNKVFLKTAVLVLYKLNRFKHPLVSQLAKRYHIDILEVDNINTESVEENLLRLAPDIILSIQFPQIIKENILRLPKLGAINIHKALLPKYRGMNPIFWAMLNGEKETGVTAHFMERAIDSGDIIDQRRIPISDSDSLFSLTYKCADIASDVIHDLIKKIIEEEELHSFPQNRYKATYYTLPTKKDIQKFKRKKLKFL